MPRYSYDGDIPVDVPDLHGTVTLDAPRDEVFPLQPGDKFTTTYLELNNATFTLLTDGQPVSKTAVASVDPTPEPPTLSVVPEAPEEA